MFSFTEQFSAATANAKSQLETQLDIANHYASTAFQGVQQVIALNFSATKASVEKTSAATKHLLEAKDPREFFTLNTAQTPNFDNLLAYSRELYSITTRTQAELLELVKEQIKDATAATAAVAAKPLALVNQVAAPVAAAVKPAAAPVPAPAAPEPAPAPAAAAAPLVVEAAPEAQEEEVVEAPAASPKAAAKAEAKAKPATPAKPVVEAVAELGGKPAANKPVAAEIPEAKPVVLKSVSPKK
ncbi:phasin family protein [Pseudoduganella namucuonensis]|uniref:Phasin family protein n=1 Tax=Pseudoduganella namucuonensis TaxID=1035707 RepID=A0A1I7FJX3_9BURK|nr:phasin family protein [Pseudoduganella namucuonensis]SFU36435.1 phasin family protein [Pseudoduganella namucuonensis]